MRPTDKKSNVGVARNTQGVHAELRTTSSAKFFYEVFPSTFANNTGHATANAGAGIGAGAGAGANAHVTAGIKIETDAIERLWEAFSELPSVNNASDESEHDDEEKGVVEAKGVFVEQNNSFERIKDYWVEKLNQSVDGWDTVSFYSARFERDIKVTMPLNDVLAAIATLILDRDNCFYREKNPKQARQDRLQLMYQNMLQVANHGGLCHTGVRDALMMPLNGVIFYLNGVKQCYRFPEQLHSHFQYLQSEVIEAGLKELQSNDPEFYRKQMLAWLTKDEDEREMPDELKDRLVTYFNKTEVNRRMREL